MLLIKSPQCVSSLLFSFLFFITVHHKKKSCCRSLSSWGHQAIPLDINGSDRWKLLIMNIIKIEKGHYRAEKLSGQFIRGWIYNKLDGKLFPGRQKRKLVTLSLIVKIISVKLWKVRHDKAVVLFLLPWLPPSCLFEQGDKNRAAPAGIQQGALPTYWW